MNTNIAPVAAPATMTLATVQLSPHNRLEAFLDIEFGEGGRDGFRVARIAIGRAYATASKAERMARFERVAQAEVNMTAERAGCAPLTVAWV